MIVQSDQVPPEQIERVRGGEGHVVSRTLCGPVEGSALKAIVLNRLPPGSSVGPHRHIEDEDFYYCLSGTGVVLDHDGTEHPFTPGTFQITRRGGAQGLRNTGTVDLVWLGGLVA